jgi:riboflavin kinase/FMN adenylyltransferase
MPESKSKQWISGTVVRGAGRGKDLGFPTANLALYDASLRPPEGIYACFVTLSDKDTYKAVLHVGPRPVFHDDTVTVELHILDFPDQDLYGQSIQFMCIQKLRDIENFATIEKLREAIHRDCLRAYNILSHISHS